MIEANPCVEGCTACVDDCPSDAIRLTPFALDLGRCVFCDECARICPQHKVKFTAGYRMAARTRDGLVMKEGEAKLSAVAASARIRQMFGRSLKLRSVSAGGCNGCELEINATTNVNFDAGR
ncbi:MAG: NADH:ubiquinone oxidoreductase, partial [Planctomycetes bacterium]|nr:NADH:ubiquinone oxidoreductase [Planctomycetota bacterium]